MTVIKKPDETISITLGIGIPADGETWTYGLGCTLTDSEGKRFNFTSYNKMSAVPAASGLDLYGTVGQSQYLLKGTFESGNRYVFQSVIPAAMAEGLIEVYATVWKKQPTGSATTGVTTSDLIIDATESEAYDYQKKTWNMSLSMTVA
jgi:hypothetical protein